MLERRYLFVAIGRATRWVFLYIYGDMADCSSVDFLRRLKLASPIKISKILTDNSSQFTDRFAMKDKRPSGQHTFDKVCSGMAIEPSPGAAAPPSDERDGRGLQRSYQRVTTANPLR